MIRSGSTLQFNIVKSILDYTSLEYINVGYLSENEIILKKQELAQYATLDKFYIIKTHDYTFLNTLENVYTIYSFRSVLDVAGSVKRKFKRKEKELYKALEKGAINHTMILNKSNRLLEQEYEFMLKTPVETVRQIMSFLKIDLETTEIEGIAKDNSAGEIRKTQNNGGQKMVFKNKIYDFLSHQQYLKRFFKNVIGNESFVLVKNKLMPHNKSSLLHADHVSKNLGQNGNWNNILSQEEVEYIQLNFPNWESWSKNNMQS